ncbi:MAG: hypothetical protein ACON4Z_04140 [Planctomycetota bacterium]
MFFAEPSAGRFEPQRRRPLWAALLFGAAFAAVTASCQPWLRVRFDRLFGEVFGPPAWQSTAGFTCLCTSALLAVMAAAETNTRASRSAVRPASLMLAVIMACVVATHVLRGPGMLRGVSAMWTASAYVGAGATAALVAACAARFSEHRRPRPTGPS